jgi:sugar phosphate isomerase/epimerase
VKISIASYAFHGLTAEGRMDVFGYLESVKHRYRLDAADIWNGTMAFRTDEDFLRKVRQDLDERELVVASLCVDRAHIWDADEKVREKNYENALANLRAAEILGARTVRIDMGGREPGMTTEQFDLVVRRYSEWAKRAGDGGYRIGPETHFGPSLVPENMANVYRAVGHPAYGVLLHIGHWTAGREDEGDRLVAPWVMHVHVDFNLVRGRLEEKMRMLADAGYRGYWGVEHQGGANEYAEVEYEVADVRRTLARIALNAR